MSFRKIFSRPGSIIKSRTNSWQTGTDRRHMNICFTTVFKAIFERCQTAYKRLTIVFSLLMKVNYEFYLNRFFVKSNDLRRVGFLRNPLILKPKIEQLIPKPQLGNVNEILTLTRGYHETINWRTYGIFNT